MSPSRCPPCSQQSPCGGDGGPDRWRLGCNGDRGAPLASPHGLLREIPVLVSPGLSGAPQPRVVMVAGAAWRGARTLLVARFGGHVPQEMSGTSLVAEQSVGHWQCAGSFVTALAVGQQERGCPLALSPGRWGSLAPAWP